METAVTTRESAPDAGGLPDSAPLIGRPEELRQRWEADGVLYFRNVVDPEAIAAVRENYLARLQELGTVPADASEPVWTGVAEVDGKRAGRIDDAVWKGLVQHPSFDRVIRGFLGEAPSWVPIVVHRASPPVDPAKIADPYQGRHQDGVFNYGIDFITCWVPLMDIDDTVGGLAVVPGSHKRSYYDFAGRMPDLANAIAPGRIAEELWRRPDYKAGDILMFHSMTAHAGLPNTSDRFRLSMDVRYLPGSEPTPMVGTLTAFDGKAVDLRLETGEQVHFVIDDEETMVRGPKGGRVMGEEMSSVLFPGANVIAVPDVHGRAKLVRSVSRKFIDLPRSWFSELPGGWVN